MQYREIVAITGLGGLYQLLTTKSDGAIVKSLADNSTKFISARLHNVTPLDKKIINEKVRHFHIPNIYSFYKKYKLATVLL